MSGSLAIISHSIIDFLDDSVKMYGQAILDMATYKILAKFEMYPHEFEYFGKSGGR